MRYLIEKHKGMFYVFRIDEYGNKYDTFHHFRTKELAKNFIIKDKLI